MIASVPELRWHSASGADGVVQLVGGAYRIGRDPAAEIVIDAPGVSQQHALLERIGQGWVLRDLASTNGLWWR
ncbi:MAG: hypothetical protein RLZZ186_759, partial [Cyanobacteriota bacterium]